MKIDAKKIKLLRMGMSKGEELMLDDEKIFQVDSSPCQGSIIRKDSGCSKDVKSTTSKAHGVFYQFEKKL